MASSAASGAGSGSGKQNEENDRVLALSGEIIFLPDQHYDDLSLSIIRTKAKELGAEIDITRENCTIVLYNERSPLWPAQSEDLAESTTDDDKPLQFYPYHWLFVCHHRKQRVESSDLPVASPFMVQQLTSRHPLKVWVSKNVNRRPGETPDLAYANVIYDVESVGAITVTKRAHADVLIVDRQSKFFRIVEKEKEDNQRDWQKLAQRDWVNFCLTTRSLQLTTPRDDEEVSVKSEVPNDEGFFAPANDADEVDSMVAEDDVPVGTGPGRPTGKPRVEYSPEDDDFLVRWLACYYSHGSWGSRKTYQELIHHEDQYPLAGRHSSQSWHERFKKNSGPFTRRVKRFILEGIDATLKTRAEREKAAEKEAVREASEQAAPQAPPSDTAQAVATSSRQLQQPDDQVEADRTSAPPPITVAVATTRTKRVLVESDSEDREPKRVDRKGKQRAITPEAEETNRVLVPETMVDNTRMDVDVLSTGAAEPASKTAVQVLPDSMSQPAVAPSGATYIVEPEPIEGTSAQTAGPSVPIETFIPVQTTSLVQASLRTQTPPPARDVRADRHKSPAPVSTARSVLDDIPTQPASALLGSSNHRGAHVAFDSHEGDETTHRAGSTPLRQEILRSVERRKRGQSSASRHAKRGPSPDKVYAHVNIPPPRPVVIDTSIPAPPAPQRSPPRYLTPEERAESVLAGSRIVQDVAAQYRAKVAALRQRFGVGIKEVSAATNEVKRRNGGKSAVDWGMLEAVLEEQYGPQRY